MKRKLFISIAALGLLFGGLVACNGNKSSEAPKSSDTPASSESAKPSSSSVAPSSQTPASSSSVAPSSSSAAPAHEHSYVKVGESVKNADQKDVYVMECADKDDKYIGIAFDDYSSKSADFDSGATASKYKEVDADIIASSHMLAKGSSSANGGSVTWKFNLDKAITGAKIAFGVTSTYASHGTESCGEKYLVKVNDGEEKAWEATGTYDDIGLAPTKITYVVFNTVDLVAGENSITVIQGKEGYRLLFGGEVRIHYSGDAKPVEAPVPFEGYQVTFVAEHCKVLVYESKDYTKDPVETNSCIAKDEEGNIVAYDPDDIELQPQVNFRIVCDEGYSVNTTNITITGKYKNIKQGPSEKDGLPDDSYFRVTKIQENITITIAPAQGEQAIGQK